MSKSFEEYYNKKCRESDEINLEKLRRDDLYRYKHYYFYKQNNKQNNKQNITSHSNHDSNIPQHNSIEEDEDIESNITNGVEKGVIEEIDYVLEDIMNKKSIINS